jgi:GTP-binding protein YchF
MALSIGIVGLPNVGKSTLFNALTKNNALAANYPFATIDPNTGVVNLPDERLEKLAPIVKTDKIVHATVSFVDIAGIVKGASKGEGLGNQFLANIREANAICEVTRVFKNPDIVRDDQTMAAGGKLVDPASDIDTINTELMLADLQTIEKALPRLAKDLRGGKIKQAYYDAVMKAKSLLEAGETIFHADAAGKIDKNDLYDLHLLSAKPFIYVFNVDDDQLHDEDLHKQMRDLVAPAPALFINADFEAQLNDPGLSAQDVKDMLDADGLTESGLDQLARVGFDTLGLQTFLTAGPKEVHAWTIHKGWTAPQAAGVIHSDFEKGFIKAEIVKYDDLIDLGSYEAVKEAGKVHLEGKDYVMQDGDIAEFKFNVSKGK